MKYKKLFYFELGICFFIPILWALMGLLFLPAALLNAAYNDGAPQLLLMTIGGFAGLIALFLVARSVVRPAAWLPHPVVLWPMILAGLTPLLWMMVIAPVGFTLPEIFAFYLPLLCAIHVIYLARENLFLR